MIPGQRDGLVSRNRCRSTRCGCVGCADGDEVRHTFCECSFLRDESASVRFGTVEDALAFNELPREVSDDVVEIANGLCDVDAARDVRWSSY